MLPPLLCRVSSCEKVGLDAKNNTYPSISKVIHDMSSGMNPFVLLARITVKEGKLKDYLAIASEVDSAVEATEEGMLLHQLDTDPDDPNKLVWTEIYRRSEDFLIHADNPPVVDYVNQHQELALDFTVEIYGNVSSAVLEKLQSLEVPCKHFRTTQIGYVRSERFC